ncbi:MAG: PEP-CTERM sorting domain-containing protein [Phycisphaerae bacterium]
MAIPSYAGKARRSIISALAAAAVALSMGAANWTAAPAAADNLMAEYYLPSTDTGSAHELTGRAIFTYLTSSAQGNMQVELINDSSPDSVNDLISGISFGISTPGSGSLASAPHGPDAAAGDTADPYAWSMAADNQTGPTQITGLSPLQTSTISAGITSGLVVPWTVGESAGQYSLSVGGAEGDLLGPTGNSLDYQYFSNTSSVSASDPILAGPVFFNFTIPDLQSTDSITGVTFGYGTGGNSIAGNPAAVPAPEPSVLALFGMGAIGSLILMRKRHWRHQGQR